MTPASREQTVIIAAQRDASWHRRPGRGVKYHVIVNGEAACSPTQPGAKWPRMTLVDFTEVAAVEVASYMRCGRPGCRQRWPEEEPS